MEPVLSKVEGFSMTIQNPVKLSKYEFKSTRLQTRHFRLEFCSFFVRKLNFLRG